MRSTPKTTAAARTLWFLLAPLGVHRLYLGRHLSGVVQAVLFLTGIAMGLSRHSLPLIAGAAIILAVLVWCIRDGVLLTRMVAEANRKVTAPSEAS